MHIQAIHCIVTGRVQGVFFRATTRHKALQLGLTGSARNLPDGSVQVIAYGQGQALSLLRDWLRIGPDMARVDDVSCHATATLPSQIPTNFTTN
ncbi:acylphosphatase [Candidatus Venteria ishoeyi]|uniref:acylphosphatase n=1 Tax=Candidatus Venteria ishoeyi TaxID=1899563 RepID=A0A1H6F4U7_9GAMM|nr:acylphosphatase [Candidatus Venteria ishoeyi]SEH04401.1 Acylphosphatase [Candidatus Venteria ishoeyi]